MFKSIRAKLQLMLLLLGIIIALVLFNYSTKQAVIRLDQVYGELIEANNHFTGNVAGELSALNNPVEFANLVEEYKKLQNRCSNCHDSSPQPSLITRSEILESLHDNQIAGVELRKVVNNRLNNLNEGVRYIHEHHIATLKNFSIRNQIREKAYQSAAVQRKSSVQSAPELDIIQQTVTIQHTLSDIIQIFYILKDSQTPLHLEKDFIGHITRFYNAVNTFESYSLDAQDGLIVEELLDSGRTFENSFFELVHLKSIERELVGKLQNNRENISDAIGKATEKVEQNLDTFNRYMAIVGYGSFLFIAILILLIIKQGRTIISSIDHLVTETEKIKKDYSYRIPENQESQEEFNILSRALNAMAEDLNKRLIKLDNEVQLRTEAEQEKAETEIKLQRAKQMEAIGTLAGGIAHDFNNLLTAILGNINLATYSLPPDHETYGNLIEAEKAAKRAHRLTKQLLTFSKGGTPIKETAPIGEVIRESAFFILHGSNVDCSITIPDDLWLVQIDKGQIGQVIQNLTMNADHAMPNGGNINITCQNLLQEKDSDTLQKGLYVRVDVQDHGDGIQEEVLPQIFDPYYTTKEKGSIKGSGLGLAIVRSIISRHGGYITVDSKEGVGTTFTFFLPAIKDSQKHQPQIDGDIQFGHGRILVMDDESMIRAMMKHTLPSLGYTVETADSGEQALNMYDTAAKNNDPFILTIMDLTVPGGMGGQEAAGKILEKYPHAALLVSSGYAEDPVMVNPSEYGFQGALQKPYDLRKLSHLLHGLLPE